MKSLLAAFAAGSLACAPAAGARFPNAVEKKIVLTGPSATAVADLFGLSAKRQPSVSLPLGRMDAWAVYLLKKDTPHELVNDNEGSPPRFNSVEISDGAVPSLSVSPFWLDLSTRHPNPVNGEYSFSSPFIANTLDKKDAWTDLVRKLSKEPQWEGNARTQFRRCFSFSKGINLCIEVYADEDYANNTKGHIVIVTARPTGD